MIRPISPRVFLSHANEDRERFVVGFAERLRAKGIDVWLDKWEIAPGDSLVDKIFEEGLKNADALIVVLSLKSVNKRWVREELNTAIVKRIESNTRIIPVVIENCDIPEALKATVWVRVPNLSSYEQELEQIVNALYGIKVKPPLGNPPRHILSEIAPLSGLTTTDSLVFKTACDCALASDCFYIDTAALSSFTREADIGEAMQQESLRILDERGYINATPSIGGFFLFEITRYGFEQYASRYIADYSQLVRTAAIKVLNGEVHSTAELATLVSQSRVVLDHVIGLFEDRGYLTAVKGIGDTLWLDISPQFRRDFS